MTDFDAEWAALRETAKAQLHRAVDALRHKPAPARTAGRCPTCDSPQPSMHPAVEGGGEVTRLCLDNFHAADWLTQRARNYITPEPT